MPAQDQTSYLDDTSCRFIFENAMILAVNVNSDIYAVSECYYRTVRTYMSHFRLCLSLRITPVKDIIKSPEGLLNSAYLGFNPLVYYKEHLIALGVYTEQRRLI